MVDNDEIAVFLKEKFPVLFFSKENTSTDMEKPNLKFSTFLSIIDWGMNAKKIPILCNGHSTLRLRTFLIKHFRDHGYQVGIIFMNIPISDIENRIKQSTKPTDCFRISKSYQEVLNRQLGLFETPIGIESDVFFEIKSTTEIQEAVLTIEKWIHNNFSP